ncbi:hypothetical protein NLJ89_g9625 [Agrocybe chaxingu]|uniref:Uncharacterized protein n=1 Tax=Agrocybe chaxingu TaxID=84603 RepID=A0A9W8JT78_9AGAR|nr:hypothetical protein NLJ89_g9625 [Agrocybe chaxingu]
MQSKKTQKEDDPKNKGKKIDVNYYTYTLELWCKESKGGKVQMWVAPYQIASGKEIPEPSSAEAFESLKQKVKNGRH